MQFSQSVLREASWYMVSGLYSDIFISLLLMLLEKILLEKVFDLQR
jgi:hypothetical protein